MRFLRGTSDGCSKKYNFFIHSGAVFAKSQADIHAETGKRFFAMESKKAFV
jgi:hypothetical protein